MAEYLRDNETFSSFLRTNCSLPNSAVDQLLRAQLRLQVVSLWTSFSTSVAHFWQPLQVIYCSVQKFTPPPIWHLKTKFHFVLWVIFQQKMLQAILRKVTRYLVATSEDFVLADTALVSLLKFTHLYFYSYLNLGKFKDTWVLTKGKKMLNFILIF